MLLVDIGLSLAVSLLRSAVLIVTVSPRHELRSERDAEEFKREENAVILSVTLLYWTLAATVAGLIALAYLG